ncbi:hypothetical protein GCK32_004724 [Trichostrongylus colubriformis]|uniref:F-box domain-containing protein n=1 Tax=Trichostrongylus colubriformis TaxID=6319 RepID=A0AAN8F8Q8_TRICO
MLSPVLTVSDDLHDLPLTPPKKPFPWNQLPQELQVLVLQNLCRSDLDKCQLLNRKLFAFIRSNERWMKKRIIENLNIRMGNGPGFQLHVKCNEEGISETKELGTFNSIPRPPTNHSTGAENLPPPLSPSIHSQLRKVFRNACIFQLQIDKGSLTDELLLTVLFCVQDADCGVNQLLMEGLSVANMTSSVFLHFLRTLAPSTVILCRVNDFSRDKFSPEVLEFIVTTQRFSLNGFRGDLLPLDDDVLAHLTATDFYIASPNMITISGLRAFVERLTSGKQTVNRGIICTNFPIDGVSLPIAPKNTLRVVWGGNYVSFSTDRTQDETKLPE